MTTLNRIARLRRNIDEVLTEAGVHLLLAPEAYVSLVKDLATTAASAVDEVA